MKPLHFAAAGVSYIPNIRTEESIILIIKYTIYLAMYLSIWMIRADRNLYKMDQEQDIDASRKRGDYKIVNSKRYYCHRDRAK
jgi:hypothetical protein